MSMARFFISDRAKAAHGHVRIDCIDLSQALTQGVNILAVEWRAIIALPTTA
jgi:hypothetical protein